MFFVQPSGHNIIDTIATEKEALWEQAIAEPGGEKFGVNRMARPVHTKKPKPRKNKRGIGTSAVIMIRGINMTAAVQTIETI